MAINEEVQKSPYEAYRVPAEKVAQSLQDAVVLYQAVKEGTLDEGIIWVPDGFSVAEAGEHLVKRMETLPEDHSLRQKYSIETLKEGIDLIYKGNIKQMIDESLTPVTGAVELLTPKE